ncbi:MAG TPA: DUF933 domain-containing protein [Candidatus Aminicenantes bacterium]|nr:DUF933 domain-containing protein [Candidatus Aminicenantes bacterium]HPB56067.1 DUF933 domain-containing protein [Candidatus Aminicenantes bacterium]HPT00246.1 DUF933 domain-containing protein [Candidatus Aminicenantes bacterium]
MIFNLFGYPKTGKTTLFNLLTGQKEAVDKFSSKGELHKAIVEVPDPRLTQLNELYHTIVKPAQVEYLDTGSLAYGEVKGSTFVDLLRRGDGMVHVVRGFEDPEIPHPAGKVDPKRDILSMEAELLLTDQISVETRLERLEKDLKKAKNKDGEEEKALMLKLKEHLEAGHPLREVVLEPHEENRIRGFEFLSRKPLIHMVNLGEGMESWEEGGNNRMVLCFYGKIEAELSEITEESQRREFLEAYGISHSVRDHFIRESYSLLNLRSFFTVGEDEVRAWTIHKGDSAYDAAGKIHTDLQKGFIRAEVIFWEDLIKVGGFKGAKEKALLRLEGKEYPVKDGDIVHIRSGL